MGRRARVLLRAAMLGVMLMGTGALGATSVGASVASACAAIKNLPATYAGTASSATSAELLVGMDKVAAERVGVERVVTAAGSAAVTSGYSAIAGDLSAEISSLQHARALVNAKASWTKVDAAIVIANADNVKADNARGAMGAAVIDLGCFS